MTINHQSYCIFSFLWIYISGLDWPIHIPSITLWFCFWFFFPLACLFRWPTSMALKPDYLPLVLFQILICIGMMDRVWSCIHMCPISVNLNSFKRNWSKIQEFEKTFATFCSKKLFWLHGEVWKPTKATHKPLMNEISKLKYRFLQGFRGKILQIIQKRVNAVKSSKRIMCQLKIIGKEKPVVDLVSLEDHKMLGNTGKYRQFLWLQTNFLYLSSLLILEMHLS